MEVDSIFKLDIQANPFLGISSFPLLLVYHWSLNKEVRYKLACITKLSFVGLVLEISGDIFVD